MELSAPPPQLASNIPMAMESATQKQVVGACAPMNEFPQGEWLPPNDASFWRTWRGAERAIVSLAQARRAREHSATAFVGHAVPLYILVLKQVEFLETANRNSCRNQA